MSISRARRSGISVNTSPLRSRSLTQISGLPGPVQSLSASATGNTTATLSWSAPVISGDTAITSYLVSGPGSASVVGNTATITGLSPGTSYSFTVQAVNSIGAGIINSNPSITTTNWNSASANNGTSSVVTNWNGTGETWQVWRFLPSQSGATFTVTNSTQPFRYLVVGGGGGGGSSSSAGNCFGGLGGGGAAFEVTNWTPSLGNYTVTVGSGGPQASSGGASSFAGTSAPGGGGGANCNCTGCNNGASGGPGVTSNITGASQVYPFKTQCCPANQCDAATWNQGQFGFGGGGHHNTNNGCAPPGCPGVVYVAWRIS